jgi:hypothetical protein
MRRAGDGVQLRPSDEVAAIIVWQKDAVALVVGRDDDSSDVDDAVLAQVLLVDAKHVGRRGRASLHVVIEFEAVDVAEIARLADAQEVAELDAYRRSQKNPAHDPRADCHDGGDMGAYDGGIIESSNHSTTSSITVCYAWNVLIDQPWKIMSIAQRDWVTVGQSL